MSFLDWLFKSRRDTKKQYSKLVAERQHARTMRDTAFQEFLRALEMEKKLRETEEDFVGLNGKRKK